MSRKPLAAAVILAVALLSGCSSGNDNDEAIPPVVVNQAPVTTMLLSGMIQSGVDGADATTGLGSELILSGSSSSDANGDAMTYKWSVVSKPAASTLVLANDTTVKQTLRADAAGVYVLSLRVTDTKGAFSEKNVTILVRENVAPVTNVVVTATYAGLLTTAPVQSLTVGSAVVLDAKESKDADGDVVTTTWTLLEKPTTSTAVLAIDGAISRFVADAPGVYKIRAHGIDPKGAYSETIYSFDANNKAPTNLVVASATAPDAAVGQTITAPAGYMVSLRGYAQDQTNGQPAKLSWTLVSKPTGSEAALSNAEGDLVQVQPDRLGDYVIKHTATDATGSTSSKLTTISVKNHSPIAYVYANNAPLAVQSGPSMRLPINAPVTLRATGSSDADGDTLTYAWSMPSRPANSKAAVSAESGETVQITADLAGTYTVLLRVTDSAGNISEKLATFQAGSYAPVAVVDKSFASVLVGGEVTASADMSFDVDSGGLTYSWSIDAAPSGSTAAIAAPTAAKLAFTPDLPGTYMASVTVSDGTSTSVATVAIRALGAMAANVELNFAPLDSRYSKGLDQLVMLSTNPNAVKIVDPFSGVVKTVMLPVAGTSINLSPDGKLAAVLHDSAVSLIDIELGTLIRSSLVDANLSEVFVNNAGIANLIGQRQYSGSSSAMTVIDARTGADLSATLGIASGYGYLSSNYRGIYSPKQSRAFLSNVQSYSSLTYVDIAATGKFGTVSSVSGSEAPGTLYLSDNEDLLFTSTGTIYRSDTVKTTGKLAAAGTIQSLSNSTAINETLVMTSTAGSYPDYSQQYSSVIKRYVGALFVADTDLALPLIGGQQSYGIQVYHSTTGKQIALVQTVTNVRNGTGVRYYIVTR